MDPEYRSVPPRQKPTLRQTDASRIDSTDLRTDLGALRGQVRPITNDLDPLLDQGRGLQAQAEAFQELHNHHEISINAIITVLRTVCTGLTLPRKHQLR
jgi:ABC-type transporter Mla subunit MlaD